MKPQALLTGLLCLCLLGCSTSSGLFVLVPDRDGHVGSVSVTNQSGSVMLSRDGERAVIAGASSAPEKGAVMDPAAIQEIFGAALAAEPPAAAVYHFYFHKGTSQLDARSVSDLDHLLKEIRERESRDISINGHTDTTGDAEYNLRLSLERAIIIRDMFVQAGVKPEYLSVANHGKGNPLVPTADNVDEPRNRRVDVIIR